MGKAAVLPSGSGLWETGKVAADGMPWAIGALLTGLPCAIQVTIYGKPLG